jgi:hypothetical protein
VAAIGDVHVIDAEHTGKNARHSLSKVWRITPVPATTELTRGLGDLRPYGAITRDHLREVCVCEPRLRSLRGDQAAMMDDTLTPPLFRGNRLCDASATLGPCREQFRLVDQGVDRPNVASR